MHANGSVTRYTGLVAVTAVTLCSWSTPVVAQEPTLRVLTTRAIRTVLDEVGPAFERISGRTLTITTDIAARLVRRVRAGESFDVLVAAPNQIDALAREGTLIPDTRTDLARSGIGVAVREGATMPDISTVEAFRRTLLKSRSVAYLKEGQSGIYLETLLERLSLTAAIEGKVVRPERDIVSELVAQGEIELGMVVVTQILTTPGVRLAGPLPDEIQHYVVFSAGVSTQSRAVQAAKDLLSFLAGPSAGAVMRSQGMQPLSVAER